MAKVKTQQKQVRKTPTKYSKLLVVASKELAGRKKSLVQAERALAKAKQRHEAIIQEVARLDMVERSLKAMVDGTEPPTNVKYVYNYPSWVWYTTQYQPLPNHYNSPHITTTTVPNISPGYTFYQNSNLPLGGGLQNNGTTFVSNTAAVNLSSLPTSNLNGQYTISSGGLSDGSNSLTVDLSTHAEAVEPEYLEPTTAATHGS